MPRINRSLLRKAYSIEPYVAQLLPVCRDIHSAQNELRWIREHARNTISRSPVSDINNLVNNYVSRRSSGEPLQYILGSEFFGDLEIKCRPGVLIPRQETAASVTNLVSLLFRNVERLPSTLRVFDLCTGTGCIPLLFIHEFQSKRRVTKSAPEVYLDIVGVDISARAVQLAEENRALQIIGEHRVASGDILGQDSLQGLAFLRADVLQHDHYIGAPRGAMSLLRALKEHDKKRAAPSNDILICNPPYISNSQYYRSTSPSVRRFEPKLALVPPAVRGHGLVDQDGDLFYSHILRVAHQLDTKVLLLEVADLQQARRIVSLIAQTDRWDGIEIWRDDPRDGAKSPTSEKLHFDHTTNAVTIRILGEGEARSVLAYRGAGREWLQALGDGQK